MFRNFPLLLCLTLNVLTYANARDNLGTVLKKVAPAVSSAGTIDYKAGCSSCAQAAADNKKATLFSKDNNQKIELSVLSEEEANNAFSDLAARDDIPHAYPMDGCYARAHKMVRLLEDQGIIAGKAFIEGELFVDTKFGEAGLGYNVAPVLMVKKGSTITPYVFDPTFFSKPVPYEEWKAKLLTKSKSKLTREYYTNRFAYDPEDKTVLLKDYRDDDVEDMENTNRSFNRVLAMYQASLIKKTSNRN